MGEEDAWVMSRPFLGTPSAFQLMINSSAHVKAVRKCEGEPGPGKRRSLSPHMYKEMLCREFQLFVVCGYLGDDWAWQDLTHSSLSTPAFLLTILHIKEDPLCSLKCCSASYNRYAQYSFKLQSTAFVSLLHLSCTV